MKKMILGVAFLLGAWALFAQEAVIREIRGTVEVKAPDAAAWTPASRGQAIALNTFISTGFKSSALVVIGNSTLTVQPLTRLSLEEIARAEGGEKVDVNLRTGRIRANVKPPVGGKIDFTVRSPSATASVRGTVFEFNGTQLQVDEGRVHLAGSGGNGTYVGAGKLARTDIESGRTASAAETVKEELALPVPAGVDSAPAIKAKPPLTGEIDAGFEWK
ncbi:MAG: FecR family protein [Treponema sp.]|jgi:hypothetical protein|nr:FecR family protein [Treponema sp.]